MQSVQCKTIMPFALASEATSVTPSLAVILVSYCLVACFLLLEQSRSDRVIRKSDP